MDDKTIKLELTEDEAYTLRLVLDRVGGMPDTRRRFIDAVNSKLVDQGVPYGPDDNYEIDPELDRIYFI
jgi:hypothetical protein